MKNNQPESDIWQIRETDLESQYFGKIYHFDFTFINNSKLKDLVKAYVWMKYKTGNNKVTSLQRNINNLKLFITFAESKGISGLKKLTNADIADYMAFLHTYISKATNKPLTYKTQKTYLDSLKTIVYWGQLYQPDDVPNKEIFTGSEYIGVDRKLKIDFIPDAILKKINEALITEKNPYLKYGIIILESTGMRIGDLINLCIDCIQPDLINGYTITWFDHKNRKKRDPIPVCLECVTAIQKLTTETQNVRDVASVEVKDRLFIYTVPRGNEVGKIMNISGHTMRYWFKAFIKKNDIRNANGDLYNLTCHQFRRSLGTDMLSKGVGVNVIQSVLGINPYVVRKYYADVKDIERAKIFDVIGIIGNIAQVEKSNFESTDEMEWFKLNKNTKACLCDGYCTKPFNEGEICVRLLKRQKCYSCSRYITTLDYLEAHKQHLEALEKQVLEGVVYGDHYAEHFRPTIELLKDIIKRLEELKNDKNKPILGASND